MTYDEMIKSCKTVLVEFYATWCPHCQKMMPVVEQIRELLAGQVEIYQLDIDQNQDTADHVGVSSIPTFLLYKDGTIVWRHTGEMEAGALLGKIRGES